MTSLDNAIMWIDNALSRNPAVASGNSRDTQNLITRLDETKFEYWNEPDDHGVEGERLVKLYDDIDNVLTHFLDDDEIADFVITYRGEQSEHSLIKNIYWRAFSELLERPVEVILSTVSNWAVIPPDNLQEIIEDSPAQVYLFGCQNSDRHLCELAEIELEKNDAALLETYQLLAASVRQNRIANKLVTLFENHFKDQIITSPLVGEFMSISRDYMQNTASCAYSELARELAHKYYEYYADGKSIDFDSPSDFLALAETYTLALEGKNVEVKKAIERSLYSAFNEAVEDALTEYQDENPEKFRLVQKAYDLASKIESYFGIEVPQKEWVMIQKPDGTYGSIITSRKENYHGIPLKTRA